MMILAKTATSITGSYDPTYNAYYSTGSIVIYILTVIALWKMFVKAGEAGWKSIIPVYNVVILFKIAGLSPWLILLFLVPIANIVVYIMLCSGISKAYGKGAGTTVGLFFLNTLFILILGFGSSKYVGTAK